MATTTTRNFTSKDDVLAALASGQIDVDTASAALTNFAGANNGKISVKARPLGAKYTDSQGKQHEGKGNVLVYGLQRMPVSLYPGQWERLLADDVIAEIRKTIAENRDKLSWK